MVDMVMKNLLIFLIVSMVHASDDCPSAYCDRNGPTIQLPFWIETTLQVQPQKCAPPGFNLSCNGHIYPILHIPGSGDYYLKSVYYYIRRVILQDVEGCLPQRLLSFNLSSTPFIAAKYRNYTYFSCPKGRVYSSSVVECASNATSDVYTKDGREDSPVFSDCTRIATLPVPVSSYFGFDFGFPSDLELTWETGPNCQNCGSKTSGNVKSSDFSGTASVIAIAILFLLFIVIVVWVCVKKQGSHHNSSSSIQVSEVGGLGGRGLDRSIIETYKMITIGESCVEGPSGVDCTICLAHFAPNDTIKFLPECEHCFHVECIDKWLSMSRNCPICRVSLPN